MVERYVCGISPLKAIPQKQARVPAYDSPYLGKTSPTRRCRHQYNRPVARSGLSQHTNVYAEVDLEMKDKALAICKIKTAKVPKHWSVDAGSFRPCSPGYVALKHSGSANKATGLLSAT
jgi:hypothetical protein